MDKTEMSMDDMNIVAEFLALPDLGKFELVTILTDIYPRLSEAMRELALSHSLESDEASP